MFTLSYVNTALNQSAFRIHKWYIIINFKIFDGKITAKDTAKFILLNHFYSIRLRY